MKTAQSVKLKKILLTSNCIWLAFIMLSFSWNYYNAMSEQNNIAWQGARSFFDQILISRAWNTGHGGIYVPVTEKTQPNPYLEDPLRDLVINENLTLTKINPAYMTRQISEIAAQQEGIQFHITSLKPIRPGNSPTSQEEDSLRAFADGVNEIGYFVHEENSSYFFYMAPLVTKKPCLECHGKHGYKEGDIRGGISVKLPFISETPILPLSLSYLGLYLVGCLAIVLFYRKLSLAYNIIQTQATFDALTGIPNRRSFSMQILKEFCKSKRYQYPLSLIMCDIDNFKKYNDTFGHIKGDECLSNVARTIENTLGRPDDFCARYGGEEFVIILPNTPSEGAQFLAEKIRANIEKLAIEHPHSLPVKVVTLSLGVTTVVGTSLSQDELIDLADQALYQAKEKGRNCVQIL